MSTHYGHESAVSVKERIDELRAEMIKDLQNEYPSSTDRKSVG